MGLTNEIALNEVQKLFDLCFDGNSLCDRIAYVISVSKGMINFGDWFHHNIAHFFTGDKLADGIEAFGELRGDLFYRDAVPKHKEDYLLLSNAMEAFVLKVAEIEKQCIKALKICAEYGAEGYEDFLRNINVENITPLLKQATVFYNAVKNYENNMAVYKWETDFESYIIPYFYGGDD